MSDAPLSHLLVIETATVLAGPAVGMFFAELGARVIKVEPPLGDVTRSWKLPIEDATSPLSAYFSSVNHGKEHVRLNLKDASDRARFDALLSEADVLITNHMKEDSDKLGLDHERLRGLNPRLIHGHIKGFADQPGRPAFDVVLQAETGWISMTGADDEHLAKLPVALIDVLAAHQLKEGLLVALLQMAMNGRGVYVEVSLEEAALAGLMNQASNHLMTGAVAKPMGTLHPNIAPYGELFPCSDGGRIILAVGSDAQFTALCHALGVDATARDERFASNRARVLNRSALADALASAFQASHRDELLPRLIAAGVPAGAVRSIDEVLASPAARALVHESVIDGLHTRRLRGNAFRISY
ncbi:MAG TPA: CoA transferase [Flavobacteriales bacterium]|nr:CoA transferase [Flavobacteriales bacterium]